MDAKKIILMTGLLFSLLTIPCFGGQTTISGTMSCVMPEMFEFRTQDTSALQNAQTKEAPIPIGASGKHEVIVENKTLNNTLLQTEEKRSSDQDQDSQVTVYTVCPR